MIQFYLAKFRFLLSDVTEAGGVFLCRLKSLHNDGERSISIRTACIVLLQPKQIQLA